MKTSKKISRLRELGILRRARLHAALSDETGKLTKLGRAKARDGDAIQILVCPDMTVTRRQRRRSNIKGREVEC